MDDRIEKLLQHWNQAIDGMRETIRNRNFSMFTAAFRDGGKCFEELKSLMESPITRPMVDGSRSPILEVVGNWVALADSMEIWMREIKADAEKARHDKNVDRKLTGAYKYIKKSGRNLSLRR